MSTGWVVDPTVTKLIAVVVGIAAIAAIVALLQRAATRRIESTDARYRARKVAALTGYAGAILLFIAVFSDRLGQFTVAFGVAGAGIAFALQEVIASLAGWVAIAFGGFYNPGDRVQLGGIKGDVIDIGMLRTTLMEVGEWVDADLYNGRIVRIANSFVFKEPVFNYSAEFPFLWDEITIGVKYGSDYALTRSILERVGEEVVGEYARSAEATWQAMVRSFRLEDAQVHPVVTVLAAENWLQFTLRYIVEYKLRRSTKDRLFTSFLDEIGKVPGQVNIASSTIEITQVPALDVRMSGRGPD